MSDRKNIKLSEDTFEELQALKPEGVTWDRFLKQAGKAWAENGQRI